MANQGYRGYGAVLQIVKGGSASFDATWTTGANNDPLDYTGWTLETYDEVQVPSGGVTLTPVVETAGTFKIYINFSSDWPLGKVANFQVRLTKSGEEPKASPNFWVEVIE